VRGFDESQQADSAATAPPDLNSTSSPLPSPPLHGGEGDGLALASALVSEEHRTFNPDQIGETSSQPEAQDTAAAQHDGILSPRLSGERNEVRGFYESQIAESRQSLHQNLNSTSSAPLHGGEGDGFALAGALASGEHRTSNAELRTPNPGNTAQLRPFSDAISESDHNHVTRQELKRELDSLRRLMETRK
jgi:hypothetical protein